MSNPNDWNKQVIEEFRANGGKVGGQFANMPLLLLTTTGAKSGQPRTSPLAYFSDGDAFVILASKGGAPTNPDWYHNLLAQPQATLEVGTETFPVRARVAEGDERERLFKMVVSVAPTFGEYQQRTSRQIPLILLERM